jgi:hypothetical protein
MAFICVSCGSQQQQQRYGSYKPVSELEYLLKESGGL